MASIRRMSWRPRTGVAVGAGVVVFLGGGFLLSSQVATPLLHNLRNLPPVWLLGLALVGGTASFFSPCGLALTPAFLGYLITGRAGAGDDGARRSVITGSRWLAAGIVSFYVVVGLVVALVGSLLYRELLYLNLLVGLLFLGLGPVLLLGRRLGWLEAKVPRIGPVGAGGPPKAGALYRLGWLYGVASQSCAVPIFVGMVLVPLSTGTYWLGAATTVLYGSAIAALLVALVALGGQELVGRWQNRLGPWLQRGTGILFTLTGALLLLYAAQALSAA